MQELLLADAAVDQGGDHSDLDQAQPGYDPLRSVDHEQSNRVALLVASAVEIVGHPVAVLFNLKYTGVMISSCKLKSIHLT